ncbi:MAG: two-component hybrid sensor and regulator, partial [Myxococcaceae bacterium]|nr:two-component hybrid sensor and regulator [Myxococcaceae bacterium]
GEVVLVNAAATQRFGVSRKELQRPLPEFARQFVHLTEGRTVELARALTGVVVSPTIHRVASSARYVRTSATPVKDEAGLTVGAVVIVAELHDLPASQGQERLEALAVLAVHLAEARTQAQVVDVIIERGMLAAQADTCTLYVLDPTGNALELIGERGAPPEIIAQIRRITDHEGNPETFASLRAGRSVWAESKADYLAIFPALARQKVSQPRASAFWSMPLIAEGRTLGLLGMGFYEPRSFSPEERAFVDTFSKQSAQALLRAMRLESEDEIQRVLTTTLRSIGDAVIATDTMGHVTFMNPVAEALTGWSATEALEQPLDQVFRIFSEATGQPVESPVDKVLREGAVVGLANHTVLWSKSGRRIPIDDSGAPIRDGAGDVLGVVLVFRDVTTEKMQAIRGSFLVAAGEALASSLDYRATLATVTSLAVPRLADWCSVDLMEPGAKLPQRVAVAHVDPAKVAFAHELGERYPPDPEAPTGIPQVIRSGQAELYTEIPEALLEAGAQDAEHLRIIRELRLQSAMVVPLRGHDRTLGAMTFIYADSGRRYGREDLAFAEEFARRASMAIETATAFRDLELARAREHALRHEAEIANRAKDEFLATVSHELRTPLHAILGWAVTLRGRGLSPELDRPLAVIERNARAQARLIEDVLDVSRIISGKLSLSLDTLHVASAVAGAVEAVTPAANAKGITIELDVPRHSLELIADPDRIQQVIWNLTSNAVKFTPKGGTIKVAAWREGSDVCVSVTDTGEGIAGEALPHIFDAFHQADASTTRRHGGLGLGLAIVKQLVAAHGGQVSAHSDGPGRGAKFTVRLPERASSALEASAASSARESLPPASPIGAPTELDGLTILLVDDEEDARVLLGEQLGLQGARVHLAASAAEALRLLERVRPDILVSDIGMPIVDGYGLISQIRKLPHDRGGGTPAIALSAYTRKEDTERALAAGFQRHVAKPIEPAALAIALAQLAAESRHGAAHPE